MLDPYLFLDRIGAEAYEVPRREMARFALNLYYGAEEAAFDTARLWMLTPSVRLECLGALMWAHSQGIPLGEICSPRVSYKIDGEELIGEATLSWLRRVLNGEDPKRGRP